MKKIMLTFVVVAYMIIGLGAMSAQATTYTGSCGNNVNYSLDTNTGVLTIGGTGDMDNYSWASDVPWYSYKNTIKAVVIEDGVRSIGNSAFYYCEKITKATIADSVNYIGTSAFYYCSNLKEIHMPESLEYSGKFAFSGCRNLTHIYITDIAKWCNVSFNDTSSNPLNPGADCLYINGVLTTELIIPNSVTNIKNYAFAECESITSLIVPENVTTIGKAAFVGCDNLTNVSLPDTLTGIGESAFGNTNIKNIIIPKSVTTIPTYAFLGCSIETVTIPDSVVSIGKGAFIGCENLKDVYYAGTRDDWEKINIESNNSALTNATIYFDGKIPPNISYTVLPDTLIVTPENMSLDCVVCVLLFKDSVPKVYTQKCNGTESVTFEITDGFVPQKIMVWVSLEGMEPIMECTVVE